MVRIGRRALLPFVTPILVQHFYSVPVADPNHAGKASSCLTGTEPAERLSPLARPNHFHWLPSISELLEQGIRHCLSDIVKSAITRRSCTGSYGEDSNLGRGI
jgi:hypothetical protein